MYGIHRARWHTKRDATRHTKRDATRYASTRHAFEKIADTRYANQDVWTALKSNNHPSPAILQLDASTRYASEKVADTRCNQNSIYIWLSSESPDDTNAKVLKLGASHLQTWDG